MKIELTPENAAALAKYAALAGCTPAEFLNRFRSGRGPFAMCYKRFVKKDPLDFHDPARSLFNSFHL